MVTARVCPSRTVPAWHEKFLAMLPAIRQHARIAFRRLPSEARQEAIQETVCNACQAVARLAELGRLNLAYASVLARYGVAQVKDGRKVGAKLNCRDVLSPYCQRMKNVIVERLDRYDTAEDCWQEILVEDRNATPADLAATRLDFAAWLDTLTRRNRRIALALAEGQRTGAVACCYKISEGRVSQLRKELKTAWERFTGDAGAAAPTA